MAETPAEPKRHTASIVKLAIQSEGRQPLLYDFDQKQPLAAIVRSVCQRWNLPNADRYAFKYMDSNIYITEKNRLDLKNGVLLKIAVSPTIEAKETYQKLSNCTLEEARRTLRELAQMSKDASYSTEFINCGGLRVLIAKIEEHANNLDDQLGPALSALQELVEQGGVGWDTLSPNVLSKVAGFVQTVHSDFLVSSRALGILEAVLTNSTKPEVIGVVQKSISVEMLSKHLSTSSDPEVQVNALGLLNGLLVKASGAEKQEIYDHICRFQVRRAIFQKVLPKSAEADLAHQLYVFQTVSLSLLSARIQTQFDPNNKLHMVSLQALPQSAFPEEYGATQIRRPPVGAGPGLTGAALWKKLGFVNSNPTLDFNEVPPGVFALECIVFFARNHLEECNKFLLDNLLRRESHQCPFARSGIALTKMLCDIFRIGDAPSEMGGAYMPMFFSTDSFFEEVFSVCIQVLSKTWREMGASAVDFAKVIAMVKKQVTEVLKSRPRDIPEFKQALWEMTYAKIISIIEEEKEKVEDVTTRARPVVELRDRIKPDIVELVKKQRLAHLVEGAVFPSTATKGRTRGPAFWCCRLSPNYRVLHWGNCEENAQSVALETLPNKIPVSDIKELLVGKDCPHVKSSSGKKLAVSQAFSLMYDVESHLNFVAADEKMYAIWVDGLRVLLNQPMMEQMARDDIEMLLNMDMKLRLLDVENAPIPDHPPKIPPDPPNLNFFYKDD